MDNSNNLCPESYQILLTLSSCELHQFVYKKKNLLEVGPLQILGEKLHDETPNSNPLCFRIKKVLQQIKPSQTLVRLQYPETTSYLFENKQNSISAISFNNEDQVVESFEGLMRKSASIEDFNSELVEGHLKLKLQQSCPQNIEIESISSAPKENVKYAGKMVGGFFGTINKIVKPSSESVGKAVSQRADRFSQESFSEETKTKWKTIKEKTSSMNQKFSNFVKPVVKGYYNVTEKIGQSFSKSQNSVIKAVRQYSIAFASSVNEGEKNARNPEPVLEEKVEEIKEEVTEAQLKNLQVKIQEE